MARKNRKANRASTTREVENALKTPPAETENDRDEQVDFFGGEGIEPDSYDDDDDEVETLKSGEEEEAKKASAPSADSEAATGDNRDEESFDLKQDGDEDDEESSEASSIKKEAKPSKDETGAEEASKSEEDEEEEGKEEEDKKKKEEEGEKKEEKKEETAEEKAAREAKEAEEAEAAKSEAPKVLSPEEAQELYADWRKETENILAEHHYRLTEEQVEELNDNPAVVIPKLMSRVYMDSISAAFQQFTQYLPRMVGSVLEQRESMNVAEKTFFEKWPDLMNHRDTVIRLGAAYRQSNPNASMEEFVNEVGAQAMVALRLSVPNGNGETQQQPAGAKTAKTTPFKPATSSPGTTPAPKQPANPFEQLVSEFADEEDVDFD